MKKKKPDYELKAAVLDTDLPTLQKKISRTMFAFEKLLNDGELTYMPMSPEEASELNEQYNDLMPDEWAEARRINRAEYERVKRLKNRICEMLIASPCVFLTFTFTDDTLSRTSAETRKKYVKRFLEAQNCAYVANIDFGAKNGREHFHAVVGCEKVDYVPWHKYGAIKGERVRLNYDANGNIIDGSRLAKYVSKLTNHAIKSTTRRNVIIYSRKY